MLYIGPNRKLTRNILKRPILISETTQPPADTTLMAHEASQDLVVWTSWINHSESRRTSPVRLRKCQVVGVCAAWFGCTVGCSTSFKFTSIHSWRNLSHCQRNRTSWIGWSSDENMTGQWQAPLYVTVASKQLDPVKNLLPLDGLGFLFRLPARKKLWATWRLHIGDQSVKLKEVTHRIQLFSLMEFRYLPLSGQIGRKGPLCLVLLQ